jgi:hypothetical protein
LHAGGGEGVQILISTVSLIVRGLPRLACRSRLRQTLNALVPVGLGRIIVFDDDRRPALWPVQGPLEKPIRLVFIATRYPIVARHLWSVEVIYRVSILVDDSPEISRVALVRSKLFPHALSRLVKHMGYAASDRCFAEAELSNTIEGSARRMQQTEIDRILSANGRTATSFCRISPGPHFDS